MSLPILAVAIRYEHDVVAARQRARQIAGLLGFDVQGQTRIATAVSEIVRNAFNYAGGGTVDFLVEGQTAPQVFLARISDQGPGIKDLSRILAGQYRSATGMGLGLIGARRLLDQFQIESTPGQGTTVWLRKILPRDAPLVVPAVLDRIVRDLLERRPQSPFEEIQQQNQELLRALEELRKRQEALTQLNHELEDTNRGVVALYAELDDKAYHLRRADEMKTRFLSNMSHEFRTPVNSILALSQLLLDRTDGDLNPEQEEQVRLISTCSENLMELINDLLDLAKVEAGKMMVRPIEFEVAHLFAALRGMLRPLLVNRSVHLVFEDPTDIPPLYTDESKVSQILRNFISNALKFTERGEVRVRAEREGDTVVFSVSDTGIGIALEDQERIFQEFTQLDNPIQKRVRGTGLGLPLSKKLGELLGGSVYVKSQLGTGSTFSFVLPPVYTVPAHASDAVEVEWVSDPSRAPVLVVEDHAETLFIYQKFLRESSFQSIPARSLREARQLLKTVRPAAIILDIILRGEDSWDFLAEIKGTEATKDIPVLVATTVEDPYKGLALGADAYLIKPIQRQALMEKLEQLVRCEASKKILVIDDDEVTRYLMRRLLADTPFALTEAASGLEGINRADAEEPHVIILDFMLPDITGDVVLQHLKAGPRTRDIPVIINTSKILSEEERVQLMAGATVMLSKDSLSREGLRHAIHQALTGARPKSGP